MTYTDDTRMSEIPDDMEREEWSDLMQIPFDRTAASLLDALKEGGLTEEQYKEIIETCENVTNAAGEVIGRAEGDEDYDPTVGEYRPVAYLMDLALLGLLAHTLFSNQASIIPRIEEQLFGEGMGPVIQAFMQAHMQEEKSND